MASFSSPRGVSPRTLRWRAALAVALTHATASALMPIPALEKAVVGLNMFRMQPDGTPDTGADPGLGVLPVFNLSVSATGKTWGGMYAVPDALMFRPAPSCSYTTQVTNVASSLGYLQTLHEWARTTTRFLFWSHTVDHEFQELAEQTVAAQMVVSKAQARCTSYVTAVDYAALTPETLSLQFISDALALPTTPPSDPTPLFAFVERWGTHFMDSVTMGASASIFTSFTQANWTKLESESTNFDVGGSIAFLAAFGDASLASDGNFQTYVAFSQAAEAEVLTFVGPTPPASGPDVHINATAWASSVQLPNGNPAVIAYTAANLSSLIGRGDLFPMANASDMAARAAVLQAFIDTQYCGALASPPCVPFQRNSVWDTSLVLPLPLRSSAVVSDGTSVFAIGGCSTNNVATAVRAGMLVWNTSTPSVWGTVSSFMQLRPPFYGANATTQAGLAFAAGAVNASDSSVVIIGGIDSTGAAQAGITRFDPSVGYWRPEGSISTARSAHCAALVGSTVLVIGGSDGTGNILASVEIFDANTGSTYAGTAAPAPVTRHACLLVNGSVWVFGGITTGGAASAAIYVYEPTTDTWTTSSQPLPTARSDHAAALVGDVIFIVGGADSTGTADTSVQVFNTSSGLFGGWQQAPPLPNGAIGASAAVYYEPSSQDNVLGQGPDNGGFVIVVVGGAPDTGANTAATTTVARLKVFDTYGNFVFDPSAVPTAVKRVRRRAAALGGSAAAQLERARTRAESKATVMPFAVAPAARLASEAAAATVSASGDAAVLPVFPMVDFLSHTYDPIIATPSAQLDVGWLPQGAFQVACPTCFSQGKTLNGVWSIPDGVSVATSTAAQCSYTGSSLVLRSAAELQASLSLFAHLSEWSFNLNFLIATAFSAGAVTSVSSSASVSASEAIITTTATCTVFTAALDAYDFQPQFWPGFLAAVLALPGDLTDPTAFLTFVSRYGLAFPVSMTIGGTASEINTMSALNYSQSLSVQASIDVRASASFAFLFGASLDAGGAFAFNEWLSFAETIDSNYTQCAPQCPPVSDDILFNASAWGASVAAAPVPVSFSLLPIWDLIGGNGSASAHWAHFTRTRSLAARAAADGDVVTAARLHDAAQLLEQFAASGMYCSLTPACAPMTGGPYWDAPEAAASAVLPTPVMGAAAALLPPAGSNVSSLVVVAGGTSTSGGAPLASTFVLDTAAPGLGWTSTVPMPAPVFLAGYAAVGGNLWVVGGVTSAATATAASWTFAPSITGGAWTASVALPQPTCAHAIAQVPCGAGCFHLYSFGGCTDAAACASPTDAVYIFSSATNSWAPGTHTLPQGPAWGMAAVASADGSTIYVAGGFTPTAANAISYAFAYDVATDTWQPLATSAAPAPFAFATATLLPNSRILFVGGYVYDAVSGALAASTNTWMYDPGASAWSSWSAAPWPTASGAAVLLPAGVPGLTGCGTGVGASPTSCVNVSAPVLWAIGGINASAAGSPSINLIAQLRGLPAQ